MNPCGGACCDPATEECVVSTQAGCVSPGIYLSGAVCETTPCSGACCNPVTGVCTLKGPTGCPCGSLDQGVATVCAPSPCTMGACCNELDGTCTLTGRIGCSASRSVYKGDGTVCSVAVCGQIGACCNAGTGACATAVNASNCPDGATFRGPGTTCVAVACGGACCHTARGFCALATSAGGCPAGYSFLGIGTTCSPNSCVGACCNFTTGACTLTSNNVVLNCNTLTSIYLGPGTLCTPSACAGACCNFDGTCVFTAGAACAGTGTQWQGPGTTCTVATCPGACCNPTTRACVMTLVASCPAGSTYTAGGVCTTAGNPCLPAAGGVCCNTVTGACALATQAGCTGQNIFNAATACTSNPCTGACYNVSTGACTNTTATACASLLPAVFPPFGTQPTSIFQGVGTACAGGAAPAGACCRTNGTCAVLDSVQCSSVGTYLGAGAACPAAGQCFGEVHATAHSTRATAQAVTMNSGDRLTGIGADRYLITAARPAGGIYRHTLTISSSTNDQSLLLIGQLQFDNHTSTGDSVLSSSTTESPTAGTAPFTALRTISWYTVSAGAAADVSVTQPGTTVTGISLPWSVYTITLTTTAVAPIPVGNVPGGQITVTSVGTTLTDTDFWVFDSSLTPIPGFGSDDLPHPSNHQVLQSTTSREILTPGTYYVAITDYNLGVNQLTPLGDRNQSKAYADLPGIVTTGTFYAAGATSWNGSPAPLDLSFKIVGGNGQEFPVPATKQTSYEVVWATFNVTAPPTGACCQVDGTCAVRSQSGCTTALGTYSGDGSACGGCTPPSPGACCRPDGVCVVSNAGACNFYPGSYRGDFSSCNAVTCFKTITIGMFNFSDQPVEPNSGPGGAFVNVTAPAANPIIVRRIDYRARQAYNNVVPLSTVDVFVRPGTYEGFEIGPCPTSPPAGSGWVLNTEARNNITIGGTDGPPIPITLATPVTIPAGQTYGFYIYARAAGIAHRSDNPVTVPSTRTENGVTIRSDRARSGSVATDPNWSGALATANNTFVGRFYYTEPCIADFNGQNGVELLDIFAFLQAWFAHCDAPGPAPCTKSADVDGLNGVDLIDIFVFLAHWFAGC